MTFSTLKRKTPLKARSGFKKHQETKTTKSLQHTTDGFKKNKQVPILTKKNNNSKANTIERLDKVFSLYIRLRDCMPNENTRCISCGHIYPFHMMQCGHYFTRHNMSVRWDEYNCHSQCIECNCHKTGNIESYTPNLISKIGREAYESLCVRSNDIKKWDNDELQEMILHYTKEVKRISKEKGIRVNI